jgi:hypothetical protein
MDQGDDAAALAIAADRTRALAPDRAAEALRAVLADHRGDLTIADAAARSGLPLRDAELGLHRLLQAHAGHLSVTDRGELLFRFPGGLVRPFGGALGVLRVLGRVGLGVVRWTGRLALTVFLLGYTILAALAMFVASFLIAAIAEDGAPVEGAGYLLWATLELVSDAIYWSFHPLRAPDELGEGPHRRPRAFYERVNGFFLGPPRPAHDPRAAARLLVSEVRARRGRIGLGDVVRVTGLAPEPAGQLVSRLLVDYDGHVDVTDDGAIVYRFPALRPSTAEPAPLAPPPIWQRVRPLPAFTGNTAGTNAKILALLAFVGGFGWLGVTLGFPYWAGSLPYFGTLALLALLVLRLPFHFLRRRADRHENGRRAVLRLAHDGACERRGIDTREFADAYREAAGTTLDPKRLQALLIELGGDLVLDDHGGAPWRFQNLELELGALALVRARAGVEERQVGAVEFTSIPAEDDEHLQLAAPTAVPAETAEHHQLAAPTAIPAEDDDHRQLATPRPRRAPPRPADDEP